MPAVAKADIVQSGTVNLTIPDSFNGVYVNVVTGQTGTSGGSVPSRISGWGLSARKESTTKIKKSLTFCQKFSKTDAAILKTEKGEHDEPTKSKTT